MSTVRDKLAVAHSHGAGDRGSVLPRKSPFFEGRFGRMFRTLPQSDFDQEDLRRLAFGSKGRGRSVLEGVTAEAEETITPDTRPDEEENFGIAAGYTYLGQFIDHDITFDPASSLQRQNDPDGLVDFRTPRFDLDCLYGRGPQDQPYMYEDDGVRFVLGRKLTGSPADVVCDLPRFGENHCALIGDKRNDENVIISQLHGAMLRFHNKVADAFGARASGFRDVQREVRWHYQWVVMFDFLPKVVGEEMVYKVLPHLREGATIFDQKPLLHFFHWRNEPFIPIEFSAAAFRFGHSMVRPIYRLNATLPDRKLVFSPNTLKGLNGFREFPNNWAIDWGLFFDSETRPLSINGLGRSRVQPSYKIDTSLVDLLGFLPEFSVLSDAGKFRPKPGEIANLAYRNLLRGNRMGLPSGQAVAKFMGEVPIPDEELKVGKATSKEEFDSNPSISDFSDEFADRSPLWFYILAEAAHQWRKALDDDKNQGRDPREIATRLGPVGGRIVAEVFVGLMLGDSHSFLSLYPDWSPRPEFGARGQDTPIFQRFRMADLIDFATTKRN